MRTVLNISLPSEMNADIKKAVKEHSYGTTSEFFRALFRQWKEEEILKNFEMSKKEIIGGKGKTLKSLNDLR